MKSLVDIFLKKKLVLWDFDGTFCDTERIHFQAYSKAFAFYNHKIKEEEYYYTFTHTGGGILKEIENYNIQCSPEEIRIKKSEYYRELIENSKVNLFPEIPEILKYLNSISIKNAIASNSPKHEIECILSQSQNSVKLEGVYGLEIGMKKKPEPDIFIHALKSLKVTAQDAIIIEDSQRGLKAAENANCDAIWIETIFNENFNTNNKFISKITHKNLCAVLKSISEK